MIEIKDKFLEKLLFAYNLSEEEYLKLTKDVTYDDLEDPMDFLGIIEAKDRILKAIKNNEKIMIYGDYDCDGFSSVSILVNMFKYLNYKNIGYYIPSRYKDGYGIHDKMVDLIHSKGYTLLITVDNGVAQMSALTKAKDYGIDVILTDHHEMINELPPCYCVVHPFLKNSKLELPQCGAYVAFNLSRVVLGRIDDYLLILGALATISDMMPLIGYNRTIVRLALKLLKENKYLPFLILNNGEMITNEKDLSFNISPKVNAVGRIITDTKVNRVVNFFTTDSKEEMAVLGDFINNCNDQRKNISSEAFRKIDLSKHQSSLVVVECMDFLIEGLIGLVANRVLNELKKPCVIFTSTEEKDILKGSARSFIGFPLSETFKKLEHLLVGYGGHAQAGGLSIKRENLEEFTKEINSLAVGKEFKEKEKIIIECDRFDLNIHNYRLIKSLGPFGEGFEEPYIEVEIPCTIISYLSNGLHIKGDVNPECGFIGFNINKKFPINGTIKLQGKLELESFRGKERLSLKVEKVF